MLLTYLFHEEDLDVNLELIRWERWEKDGQLLCTIIRFDRPSQQMEPCRAITETAMCNLHRIVND